MESTKEKLSYMDAMEKAFKLGQGHPFTNAYEYAEKFPHLQEIGQRIENGGLLDVIMAFETGQKHSDMADAVKSGSSEKLN